MPEASSDRETDPQRSPSAQIERLEPIPPPHYHHHQQQQQQQQQEEEEEHEEGRANKRLKPSPDTDTNGQSPLYDQLKILNREDRDASFDLIVIGSGGGPIEDDLSSYFLKSHQSDWNKGFVSLEAGSGLGAIHRILNPQNRSRKNPINHHSNSYHHQHPFYDFSFDHHHHHHHPSSNKTSISKNSPHRHHVVNDSLPNQEEEQEDDDEENIYIRAGLIYRSIISLIITHTHLDHILSLVLTAGTFSSSPPKQVWATSPSIHHLSSLFQGPIWPKLADQSGRLPLWLRPLETASDSNDEENIRCTSYTSIGPSLSVKAFKLTHCTTNQPSDIKIVTSKNPNEVFEEKEKEKVNGDKNEDKKEEEEGNSTAFLVKNEIDDREFIFFGDLAPDSLTGTSTNRKVWKVVSERFLSNKLDTIFIECSYAVDRLPERLYGHLSPHYLFEELKCLAKFIIMLKAKDNHEEEHHSLGLDPSLFIHSLIGLNVVIIHVKEEITCNSSTMANNNKHLDHTSVNNFPDPTLSLKPSSHHHKSSHYNSDLQNSNRTLNSNGNSNQNSHRNPNESLNLRYQKNSKRRSHLILNQILELENFHYRLGCRFFIANQGDRFQF